MHLNKHLIAFDKSNVCGSHANVEDTHLNANAFTISWRHLNAHSNAQHSNAFAFVNKPANNQFHFYIH